MSFFTMERLGLRVSYKKRRSTLSLRIIMALLTSTSLIFLNKSVNSEELKIASPNGELKVAIDIDGEYPTLKVERNEKDIVTVSSVAPILEPALVDGVEMPELTEFDVDNVWSPIWGEQAVIRDAYHAAIATLCERAGEKRVFKLETRVYNEGVAFRFILPCSESDWTIAGELTQLNYDAASLCWPLVSTEATYPKNGVALADVKGDVYPPLTLRTPNEAVVSTLEGPGGDYPRMLLSSHGEGILAFRLLGKAKLSGAQEHDTLWRVIAVAENEAELIASESFLWNLSDPTKIEDTTWIDVGKTISNEANCAIEQKKLLSMVDFAAMCGMKYVQIDWGWYGTEWRWTKEEQDTWAETNPDKADDPDWRRNCEADPFTVVKGLVPYLPTWNSLTFVDLDLPELVRYGKEKGVGICLYVNDKMLKANDLEKLFTEYERWGLAGLKPGFVKYGAQEDERAIKNMIEIAARHKLWLCVHDSYLPNGFAREFPNLYSVEGGGGQEGDHPAYHDVILPFGRCLAGPFDYTPSFYCKGKSHAHQVSLLTTIYDPAPVIRGGWAIRDAKAENGFGNAFGSELEFVKRVPTDWDETRVLGAKIGQYLIMARKAKDGVWFLGATAGEEQIEQEIALDFLAPEKKFKISLWTDVEEERDGWRPTRLETFVVDSESTLKLSLQPRGGAVAIFDEIVE